MSESSCCSTSSPTFGVVSVLDFGHSNRYVTVSHCCFSLQFPDDVGCGSFRMLVCHLYIFFGEVSVKVFDPLFIYLFIYLWLRWVFVCVRGLPLVAASGGHSSLRCAGLSLSWPLLLRSTGSRRAGSVVVAHGPSCSAACGIFPDQGLNPCPLH